MKPREDIQNEVTDLIARTLNLDATTMTEADRINELSPDSIRLFGLLLAFESHYDIETAYDDIVVLNTVGDIVSYIAKVKYGQHE